MFDRIADNTEQTTSKINTRYIQINCYNSQKFKVKRKGKGNIYRRLANSDRTGMITHTFYRFA